MVYREPGVRIEQVIQPGATNIITQPILPTVVGAGRRERKVTAEAVVRGLVVGESLTFSGSSPYTVTLANRGDRKSDNTLLYASGSAVPRQHVSYAAPFVLGATTTADLSTDTAIAVEMDGLNAFTLILSHNAAATGYAGSVMLLSSATFNAAVVSGAQVTIDGNFSGTGGNAATLNELADAFNIAFEAMTAMGYGASYRAVASNGTTGLRLTSPNTGSSADVRVFAAQTATSFVSGLTAVETLFTGVASSIAFADAATVLVLADAAYSATAVYTVDYVGSADFTDSTAKTTSLTEVVRVGPYAGSGTYSEDIDYALTGTTLDWSNATSTGVITNATITGSNGTFNLGTNDTAVVGMERKTSVTIDLNGLSSAPFGYANPSTPSAATATEVARNINAVLANNINYGARYNAVATVSGSAVKLTSPKDTKTASVISLSHPTTLSAMTVLFGLATGATRTEVGTGSRPASGSTYFVDYYYTRPTSDYNNPQTFYSLSRALEWTGPLAVDNPLAVAASLLFENGAAVIMLVQVNDASVPGSPTNLEFDAALTVLEDKSTATDIIVLSTDLADQVALYTHVENMSSSAVGYYRAGWFGMPVNTAIGDSDTVDTFVYRAKRTLQTSATSPARGRLILVSGPGVEGIQKTIELEDGTTTTLTLDSTYLATAWAGVAASLQKPSDVFIRKAVQGFDIDVTAFTPWTRAERAAMASAGVWVTAYDAGFYRSMDPTTTERGGGGLIQFEQPSARIQKDNIVRKVAQAIDRNIIGVVPGDLDDFKLTVKLVIERVLSAEIALGNIGPYRDANGKSRPISLNKDIQVDRDATSNTRYLFNFTFNLLYPALEMDGTYSVDRIS